MDLSAKDSLTKVIGGFHTAVDLAWVRQRLEVGLEPEIEVRLAAYMAALREYHQSVIAGDFPSYSLIEIPKILLADALLESLNFPTKPLSHEELIPPKPRKEQKPPARGFVYLMKNMRNSYVKIGFSKAPKVREKTLQSEDPDVEIIHQFSANTKIERDLHIRYASLRIRGEWFRLSEEHVAEIRGAQS